MGSAGQELQDRVERRLGQLRQLLQAHAGGIDLLELSPDGALRVRLTGMCQGCPLKPVTMAGTVRPALISLDGVEAVEAEGARISAEAEARLLTYLSEFGSPAILNALDVDESCWDEPMSTSF